MLILPEKASFLLKAHLALLSRHICSKHNEAKYNIWKFSVVLYIRKLRKIEWKDCFGWHKRFVLISSRLTQPKQIDTNPEHCHWQVCFAYDNPPWRVLPKFHRDLVWKENGEKGGTVASLTAPLRRWSLISGMVSPRDKKTALGYQKAWQYKDWQFNINIQISKVSVFGHVEILKFWMTKERSILDVATLKGNLFCRLEWFLETKDSFPRREWIT